MIKILIGAALFVLSFFTESLGLPEYVYYILIGASYIVLGYETIIHAVKNIFEGEFFDETFLMTIATIGAFIIGEYHEAVGVMLFYELGEYLQDLAVDKSTDNIEKLMDIAPETARIIKADGTKLEVKPQEVKIGDIIYVLAGEKIALDGTVVEGSAYLDTKTVTGESSSLSVEKGDSVLSGSIVTDSPIKIEVTALYENSTVAKIIALTKEAREAKAPTEQFITRFAKYYTPAVCALAVLIAVVPSLITGDWEVWIHKALIALVISCPCALVLSVPVAFFGGIGSSARNGILVKGGTHLEALAKTTELLFDKTGTITEGSFKVTNVVSDNKEKMLEVLRTLESESNHPIAKSIVDYCPSSSLKATNVREYKGKGLSGTIDNVRYYAGNFDFIHNNCKKTRVFESSGTVVYVCSENEYLGCVELEDTLKENVKNDFDLLRANGIQKIVILSGDNEKAVSRAAELCGADESKSSLLPHEKLEYIVAEKKNHVCAFTGDGINDAPALAAADVGISMGGVGSDAAIEASDIVIMNDSLSSLVTARKISQKTVRVAKQNIAFAITLKVIFLALGSLGLIGMGWAVFADTGVALLAVLNSLRTLRNR
ncbi:MAG: cadmium-translocating P-type ATPase [Sphaerochaetaceae bacterium]|nr:cadmium-translocating P-type ATPase [Sphaerochaetaceae bacterium]